MNVGGNGGLYSGAVEFYNTASAANCTIINEEGETYGGGAGFWDHSTAGNSTIITYQNGDTVFFDSATGGNATLIADAGNIRFEYQSTGGLARVELLDGGTLDLSATDKTTPASIGSLEGDSSGVVLLGSLPLTIGGNGLSTTYSGGISRGGSLVKTGNESLSLTGANTYRGGTTITGGTLIAQARTGSATGSGAVKVNAGTLGGKGTISGPVTVGTGSGTGAFLAPGTARPDTLTLSKTLTFKADSSYRCDLSLGQAKADQVSANGVTIESGAQFVFLPKGMQMLARGTVFSVINNTAPTAISGTFANLPDGSKLFTGAWNKLRVSYEGGDGNDLTLTVVP